ncbi:MAG TPA: hypothetical protein PK537_02955, partial [Candidatus Limiplasma sp.]|nr:hypothetical protein [Candidatus Limiplasma sp.]
ALQSTATGRELGDNKTEWTMAEKIVKQSFLFENCVFRAALYLRRSWRFRFYGLRCAGISSLRADKGFAFDA